VLAIAVTFAACTVVFISTLGAIVDQRISRRLGAEAERFRTLADGAMEGLVVHCDKLVVDANASARAMFGVTVLVSSGGVMKPLGFRHKGANRFSA
jgi:hypothetical protein